AEGSGPLFLFTDTNFFLQLKQVTDLPWGTVCSGKDLVLVVPRAVQKEISRLKSDGNSRRAKRARSAAGRLMGIAQSTNGRQVIRESAPRIEIMLADRGPGLLT